MIKGRKSLLISILAILLVFSFCFTVASIDNQLRIVSAKTVEIENTKINDNYAVNNKVTLPQTIDVEYKGKTYTTTKGIVYFPNGKLVDINTAGVLLDTVGLYDIKYTFKADDGNYINAVKTIAVTDDLYNFSVNNGSNFTVGESSETPAENNDSNIMFSRNDGLIVRLNNGSSFNYNKPINLASGGDEETAEILKFDARLVDVRYNSETNKYERVGLIAEELKIKLTDCYDSMNSIEIIVDVIGSSVYFRVRTATSAKSYGLLYEFPTKIESNSNNKEVYIDDMRGIAYFDNYGTYFAGYVIGDSGVELPGYALTYDYELNRVYYEYNGKKVLICDLMNTTMFDSDDFTPFTTGEVFLSMTASAYKKTTAARVDILSIGGEKVTENHKLYDTVAPQIEVDIDCTENNVVYIAKNETFNIPSAKVIDVNYSGKLNVDVYRNYASEKQSIVCSNAKSFVANIADAYSVVYSASDVFGNTTIKVINVVVVNTDKSLDLAVEKLSVAYFGENNILPEFETITINDSKKVSVAIFAEHSSEKCEIDTETMIFKPKYLGKYRITYKFSDNVFESEYSYEVDVQPRKDVVFLDDISFYDNVIKNAAYKITPISAFVKSANGYTETQAECFVSFDGKDFIKVVNTEKVKIEAQNTVEVKFMYQGVSSNTFCAQVIDVGFGDTDYYKLSKYFVGDFDVLEYDSNGKKINNIAFQSNVDSGNNLLKFVNPIDVTQFKLEYRTPLDNANYEKLNIKLYDTSDKNNSFTITIRQGTNASAFISVNGDKEYLSSKKFAGEFVNSINYNGDLKVLNINGIKFSVDLGFESIFANMEIEMENIYGESTFTIVKINNAIFDNSVKQESSQPLVNIEKAYGQYEINSIVNIKTPILSDVLTPINYDTVKFTVVMPDQNFMISLDGILLDGSQVWKESYDLELTQYGLYTVTYYGQDYLNNKCSGQYRFEVKDKNAPQIIINNDYSESNPMRVGLGKVEIKYQISDNLNSNADLIVMINLMNNKTMAIQKNVGQSFTVQDKGEYTVFIYAIDKDRNSCYTTFKLIVD